MSEAPSPYFRLRVRFIKQGRLRYLSHLELLHACERIVMRSHLPFAITQGFSPHMRIAFGPALPVGVASDDEWFDLVLQSYLPAAGALARLQACAPEDLMPQDAFHVDMRAASLSAALTLARWEAHIYPVDSLLRRCLAPGDLARSLQGLTEEVLQEGSISYLRNGKPKTVQLHGRVAEPLQFTSCAEPADGVQLRFATRSDEKGALRPDVLLSEILGRYRPNQTACPVGSDAAAPGAVPCEAVSLTAHITRRAQFIESRDGSWLRPDTH